MITNGASGNNQSVWYGTVWAPYGGINVGSGSSPSKVIGALWSGTQVILDNGVAITYAPFSGCVTPDVNAGSDKSINCDNPTTQLNGSSSTPNVQYRWTSLRGNFTSSIPNPVVNAGGTYVLSVTETTCGTTVTDTVIVTSTPCVLPYYPPAPIGKVPTKLGSELTSLVANFGNVADSAKAIFHLKGNLALIDVISVQGNTQSLKSLLINKKKVRNSSCFSSFWLACIMCVV